MEKTKNIAIISFDSKKTDLIEWSYFNKNVLTAHNITAIGFAGNILEGTLNKKVNCIQPGNFGGYRQLKNLIAENKIDAIIIFGEAYEIFDNKYLKGALETAVHSNIIVAANRTTADFLVHSSLMENNYTIETKEKKQANKIETLNTNVSLAKAS